MGSSQPTCVIPDLGPEVYAQWRASEIGAITEQRRLILELVGDVSGCRVLDMGCGDGEFAVELKKRGATLAGMIKQRPSVRILSQMLTTVSGTDRRFAALQQSCRS